LEAAERESLGGGAVCAGSRQLRTEDTSECEPVSAVTHDDLLSAKPTRTGVVQAAQVTTCGGPHRSGGGHIFQTLGNPNISVIATWHIGCGIAPLRELNRAVR
jgi:hypothetical protein